MHLRSIHKLDMRKAPGMLGHKSYAEMEEKMANHNILLVCGSGASSGFMAANIRKAASARGLEWKVTARSESEILNYVEDIDCLMVGPHLESNLGAIEEDCEGYDIKVSLLTKEAYSKLNGELAVDQILEMFGEK